MFERETRKRLGPGSHFENESDLERDFTLLEADFALGVQLRRVAFVLGVQVCRDRRVDWGRALNALGVAAGDTIPTAPTNPSIHVS